MNEIRPQLALAVSLVFAGAVAQADEAGAHNPTTLITGASFISNHGRTDYLRRTYGYAVWRHWDQVPQEVRDNFDWGEGNPIWIHHGLLSWLEKELQGVDDVQQQRDIFHTLAADFFSEEDIPSVAHYMPAVVAYLQSVSVKLQYEDTLMERYLDTVRETYPDIMVQEPPSLSTPDELDQFTQLHGASAQGAGVQWGEYGVAHSLNGQQIIATDFLMDCVAVVLTSYDPENPEDRYAVLAHVDATTEPREAMAKLLDEIPEGHVITAQILGSDRNENAYMNVALAEALVLSGRISSIGVNTEAATTVAIHAESGIVLSSNNLDKGEHNAYHITTLPVQVEFSEEPPFSNFRSLNYRQLIGMTLEQEYMPVSPIVRTAHPSLPNEPHPALDELMQNARADGYVSEQELQQIARIVSDNMYAPDGVCIQIGEFKITADIGSGDPVHLGYNINDQIQYSQAITGYNCNALQLP